MLYTLLKHLHITCVSLSILGFGLRFAMLTTLSGRAWWQRQPRLLRALPHINDTLLLTAALAMSFLLGQYPFVDTWLTAKVFGLIAYIVLGAIALQTRRPLSLRFAAAAAALLCYGWIISVALTKHPVGFLAW